MLLNAKRSLLAGASLAVLSAGTLPSAGEACRGNIVDALVATNDFNILVAAVEAAGLADALQGDGPFTLFAPTDRAFETLPPGLIDVLLSNPTALANVLLYHVAPGELLAADVTTQPGSQTLLGERIGFSLDGGSAFVNNSKVLATDLQVCNGVIHAIDSVLLPDFKNVEGFRNDVVNYLTYVNYKTGDFSTLLTAVQVADLVGPLKDAGPYTLFAPTDAAFAALPPGTVESLIADPPALANILLYHVVPQELFAADVVSLPGATTLQGADLSFSVDSSGVFVESSQVIVTDQDVSNGVIHFIDAVLLPPTP